MRTPIRTIRWSLIKSRLLKARHYCGGGGGDGGGDGDACSVLARGRQSIVINSIRCAAAAAAATAAAIDN